MANSPGTSSFYSLITKMILTPWPVELALYSLSSLGRVRFQALPWETIKHRSRSLDTLASTDEHVSASYMTNYLLSSSEWKRSPIYTWSLQTHPYATTNDLQISVEKSRGQIYRKHRISRRNEIKRTLKTRVRGKAERSSRQRLLNCLQTAWNFDTPWRIGVLNGSTSNRLE